MWGLLTNCQCLLWDKLFCSLRLRLNYFVASFQIAEKNQGCGQRFRGCFFIQIPALFKLSSRFRSDGSAVENASVMPLCTFHHLSLLGRWYFWQRVFCLRFVIALSWVETTGDRSSITVYIYGTTPLVFAKVMLSLYSNVSMKWFWKPLLVQHWRFQEHLLSSSPFNAIYDLISISHYSLFVVVWLLGRDGFQ